MACTNHPLTTTTVAPCASCSRPFCEDCRIEMDGRSVCGSCKASAMALAHPASAPASPEVPPPRKPNVPSEDVPPWEKRAEHGWWKALWMTLRDVMLDPVTFFRRMDKSVVNYDALFLFPSFATVNAVVGVLFQIIGIGALMSAMQGVGGGGGAAPVGQMLAVQGAGGCVGVVVTPIIALAEIVIFAGAIHVALVAMKANTRPFSQTLRGCAYGFCPYVLGIIPVIGNLVAFFWMLVVQIIMTREVHGTTTGKAVVATLWLMVFCCFSVALVAGGIAAFAFAKAQ